MNSTLEKSRSQWHRVSRVKPCPICGRPDWCLVAADGGAAICSRVESQKRIGDNGAGWLHRLRDDGPRRSVRTVPIRPASDRPTIDAASLAADYTAAVKNRPLQLFAGSLGVSVDSLRRLGIGRRPDGCWSFPMADSAGRTVGIRLRAPSGRKFSELGWPAGLFIPTDLADGGPLLMPEGPTDTAALLDLGFDAVGRPSCTGGVRLACEYVKTHRISDAVVVGDIDTHGAGQRGAQSLASTLAAYCRSVRVIFPPNGVKDFREWKRAGATRADVLTAIGAARPTEIHIEAVAAGTRRRYV